MLRLLLSKLLMHWPTYRDASKRIRLKMAAALGAEKHVLYLALATVPAGHGPARIAGI